MTREIPLSQGEVALVDDEDYEAMLALAPWHVARSYDGLRCYAKRKSGAAAELMHTVLTGWGFVDHANGDGLDNRKANLRPADKKLNGANRRLNRNNTSGFKGVGARANGRWRAEIWRDGKCCYLGTFDTPEAAARAYDDAAVQAWGEYARTNLPAF